MGVLPDHPVAVCCTGDAVTDGAQESVEQRLRTEIAQLREELADTKSVLSLAAVSSAAIEAAWETVRRRKAGIVT